MIMQTGGELSLHLALLDGGGHSPVVVIPTIICWVTANKAKIKRNNFIVYVFNYIALEFDLVL